MKNVLAYLTEYKAMKAEYDKLEKQLDAMKKEISEYVLSKTERNENGKATYICKPFTVTVTECHRTKLDEKTIKKLYPEIAKENTITTVYDTVKVN